MQADGMTKGGIDRDAVEQCMSGSMVIKHPFRRWAPLSATSSESNTSSLFIFTDDSGLDSAEAGYLRLHREEMNSSKLYDFFPDDTMAHEDAIFHLAQTRLGMCRGTILATSQYNLDALRQMETWGYAENTMELFWPALKETKRFANPQGKIETELIESMVAIHHVNNPAGHCARIQLMDEEDFSDHLRGKDGRDWKVAFHGTSTISSLEIIKKCDSGACAFNVTDNPMQSCLDKMQKYKVTPEDLLQYPNH